jgi:TetR/AcrR family transcriptional regulator, repressor of fatR-cypB operon
MKLKDENKESEILDATLRLVSKVGIVGITIKDIAKEANLGVGTIYVYFSGKEELLEKLFIETKKKTAEIYFSNLNVNDHFKVSFKRIWLNILQHRLDYHSEAIFTETYYHSQLIKSETKVKTNVLLAPLFQLVEEGKSQQLIKNINTILLLTYMVGPIVEMVNLHIDGQLQINQEIIDQAFQLSWDGIKA